MQLRSELTYDAPPDEVFAMLCDQDFRETVCAATQATSYDVTVDVVGDGVRVRVHRVMPLPSDVPDMARKLVGDSIEIVHTEEWGPAQADGSRTARLRVEVPGKPVTMPGTIVLAARGTGSHESLEGDVKVSVPFVGGKLEQEIARGILAAIEVEGSVGRAWLAGDR
ncbi:MAG: DUF2505 domain-containing protein [Actinomycetota bacterium]|nr:DUF2505 domain-containing protein [Actinomycetota bacterium]